MSRLVFIILSLLMVIGTSSQSLSVNSFRLLDSDLTANTAGTMEQDQNGETAALIKVVTTQTGFSFDCGSMGIVKTLQKPSEIWVYVPRGVKKMTVSHPQLGLLRDYYFPISIDAARTYEMVLTTGTVQTIVKQTSNSQYLVLKVTPSDAVVELDNEILPTTNGIAQKFVKLGSYEYRVQAPDYHTAAGKVEVNDPQNKKVVEINLNPAYGWIEIPSNQEYDGAQVFIDNALAGTIPMKSKNLPSGEHNVKIVKSLYNPYSQTIVVKDNETTMVTPTLSANFSEVTITVDNDADIYVNDEKKGSGSWTGKLATGTYLLEAKKENHRGTSQNIDITATQRTQTIKISAPSPIYGEANITSTPALADVYIDGKIGGQTPLYLPELLIGKHQVKIKKEGYEVFSDTLQIKEEERCTYTAVLEKILKDRIFKIGSIEFKMIRVKGGSLSIKDNKGRKDIISLSTYYIGETEVTQELWKAIMGNNPSDYYNIGDKKPVDGVSWFDCQKFISLLNQKTDANFRLPTEAEWEFAARGGNDSYGFLYSGSNSIDEIAWYESNCKTTKEVKTKNPNELGLYDMSGNIQEWCNDWYGNNMNLDKDNPNGAVPYRVLRGGSYNLPASYQTTTRRDSANPKFGVRSIGFRLVLSNE